MILAHTRTQTHFLAFHFGTKWEKITIQIFAMISHAWTVNTHTHSFTQDKTKRRKKKHQATINLLFGHMKFISSLRRSWVTMEIQWSVRTHIAHIVWSSVWAFYVCAVTVEWHFSMEWKIKNHHLLNSTEERAARVPQRERDGAGEGRGKSTHATCTRSLYLLIYLIHKRFHIYWSVKTRVLLQSSICI